MNRAGAPPTPDFLLWAYKLSKEHGSLLHRVEKLEATDARPIEVNRGLNPEFIEAFEARISVLEEQNAEHGKLHTTIIALEKQVADVGIKLDALSHLPSLCQCIENRLDQSSTEIQTINLSRSTLEQELSEQGRNLKILQGQTQVLENSQAAEEAKCHDALETLNRKLESIGTASDVIHKQVDRFSLEVSTITAAMFPLNQEVKMGSEDIKSLQEQMLKFEETQRKEWNASQNEFKGLDQKLDSMEAASRITTEQVKLNCVEVQAIKTAIAPLGREFSNQSMDISSLRDKTKAIDEIHRDYQTASRNEFEELNRKFENMEAESDRTYKQIDSCEIRLMLMEKQQERMQCDLLKACAREPASEHDYVQKIDGKVEETRSEMSEMLKNVKNHLGDLYLGSLDLQRRLHLIDGLPPGLEQVETQIEYQIETQQNLESRWDREYQSLNMIETQARRKVVKEALQKPKAKILTHELNKQRHLEVENHDASEAMRARKRRRLAGVSSKNTLQNVVASRESETGVSNFRRKLTESKNKYDEVAQNMKSAPKLVSAASDRRVRNDEAKSILTQDGVPHVEQDLLLKEQRKISKTPIHSKVRYVDHRAQLAVTGISEPAGDPSSADISDNATVSHPAACSLQRKDYHTDQTESFYAQVLGSSPTSRAVPTCLDVSEAHLPTPSIQSSRVYDSQPITRDTSTAQEEYKAQPQKKTTTKRKLDNNISPYQPVQHNPPHDIYESQIAGKSNLDSPHEHVKSLVSDKRMAISLASTTRLTRSQTKAQSQLQAHALLPGAANESTDTRGVSSTLKKIKLKNPPVKKPLDEIKPKGIKKNFATTSQKGRKR